MTKTTSPDSSPSPLLEEDLVDLPGFGPAPPPRTPDPLDPEATTTGGPDVDEWADDVAEMDPRPASETPPGGSSKASTSAALKVDWRDLMPVTGTLVAVASMLVRWVRTRRRALPEGVWIADEDDAAAIAAPLARIAARRSPISGEGSADMVDGLEVLVGATGYAMKNLEAEARGGAIPGDDAVTD